MMMMMTTRALKAYFAMVYVLKGKCGGQVRSSTHNTKSVVIVTVTCALMIKIISGRGYVQSRHAIMLRVTESWSRAHIGII